MLIYRTQLVPPTPFVKGERTMSKPDHLRLLDLIIAAAKLGQRCPSNELIADRLSLPNHKTAPGILFSALIEEGLINLFSSSFGRVVYVIDRDLCTCRPKGGKNRDIIETWYREITK